MDNVVVFPQKSSAEKLEANPQTIEDKLDAIFEVMRHPHIREARDELIWLKKTLDETFRAAHVWRIENDELRKKLERIERDA
jgi:regulator of replication initiation timing